MPNCDDTPHTLGLIGDPVVQSLSPRIYAAAFKACGLHYVYLPILLPKKRVRDIPLFMRMMDIVGLNVTTPHKAAVLKVADVLDPAASAAQAANTLYYRRGKLHATTTDGIGLVKALKYQGVRLRGKRVSLVGAGGTARAIALALVSAGCQVQIFNRTVSKQLKMIPMNGLRALPKALPHTDILIHATSAKKPPIQRLSHLPKNSVVVDCQYRRGGPTPLLQSAKRLKLKVVDGRLMLAFQAAESFQIWTGKPAPLSTMIKATMTR